MNADILPAEIASFFTSVNAYYPLKEETKALLIPLLRQRRVKAKELYLAEGARPHLISFVYSGLFSYYTSAPNGDYIIKLFFAENSFMAATSALISGKLSSFAIKALEDSSVVELDFYAFKQLTTQHIDLALFWISYLEKNWVVAKEENEINLKYLTAKDRYEHFKQQYPNLLKRIKLKDMAAYLGITPTQLSRIRNNQHK